jgi:hypothetical protein
MFGAQKLKIEIIDTLNSDKVLNAEYTAAESPTFILNGDEDKFTNLNTTELHFNMVVTSLEDGVFFHLFTGAEIRFKVLLLNFDDAENPEILWSGFLLPEQYSEPYIGSTYFVEFVATDGIGRIKDRYLPGNYYQDNTSVLDVIHKCLILTGLRLPILFAEAIQNSGFDLNYKDLDVQTKSYKKDNDKKDAYSILLACLESIGCKLFQYKNQWIIVGLNRINDTEINFKKFEITSTLTLNYLGEQIITRNIIKGNFLATPIIEVLSPLQKMEITWDAGNAENLIPLDAVTHLPINIDTDISDRSIKYWETFTDKSISLNVWLLLVSDDYGNVISNIGSYYNGLIAPQNVSLEDKVSGPFVSFDTKLITVLFSDLENNFAQLATPFFIEGNSEIDQFATLEIEFSQYTDKTSAEIQTYLDLSGAYSNVVAGGSGISNFTAGNHGLTTGDFVKLTYENGLEKSYQVTYIDGNTFSIAVSKDLEEPIAGKWVIDPFKNHFFFAVTRKDLKNQSANLEEVVLSNFATVGVPSGIYDFQISHDKGTIKCFLEIEKLLLLKDGYYNIKLYPAVTHDFFTGLQVFTKCNFTKVVESEIKIIKERNINYTTSHSLEVFHAGTQNNLSNKSFVFGDTVVSAINNGSLIDESITLIPTFFTSSPTYANNILFYTIILFGLSDLDFIRLKNGYKLFLQKAGEQTVNEISELDYTVLDAPELGGKVIYQINFHAILSDALYIGANDVVMIKQTGEGAIDFSEYWLDKWKRVNVVESIGYLEALAKIYQNCLHEFNFKISGEIIGLLTPFDLVEFKFKGQRRYNPVTLTLNLVEGKSDVVLIESKINTSLESDTLEDLDFEDDNNDDDLVLVPEITIQATAIAPSWFSYLWQIQVSYNFIDINPVNAILSAKQLTDSVANGGIYTGLEKTQSITAATGSVTINMAAFTGGENGWWEVSIEQDGILSNIEYVEILPVVGLPSERIELAFIDIGDILNYTGKFSINYIGFTPVTVNQYLQKYDINTQATIDAPIVTAISPSLTEQTITLPSSGSWKVYLIAEGKNSNEVGWLSIQI